uniref:Protein kinase domain-containing protein n=1 Tax=viral metagenome TaxID=1070528 RepID=A0A6C0M154_9ZZZZ
MGEVYTKRIPLDSIEHTILQSIHHPLCVKYIGHRVRESYIELQMEYVPGMNMFDLLEDEERLPESDTRKYISELVTVLTHIHSMNIVYGDVKLENIMVRPDGHITLVDFGLSHYYEPNDTSLAGTADYIAPEMVQMLPHSETIDWWGVGVLTYECLVGMAPFYSHDRIGTYNKILKLAYTIPDFVSQDAKEFIESLLTTDHITRGMNIHGMAFISHV